eukprot:TRINITY_DN35445_c0_g1_i1.p1 TRINITY_DN35445_c0_g1~~TRINITY_DN35445_c0_g1_i1.p1  ORF type:complete len:117 (-),score=38.61 TRINITY_DN35445_c0_g1_i1:16-345(-)
MADLKGKVKEELGHYLAGAAPKTSNLKTFADLVKELDMGPMEMQMKRLQEAEDKKLQNIRDKQEHIETLRAWIIGTSLVPFVGVIPAVVLSHQIDLATQELAEIGRAHV